MTDENKNLIDVVIECLDNNGIKARVGEIRADGDYNDGEYDRPTVSRRADHIDSLIAHAVQYKRDGYGLVIVAIIPIATPYTIKFNIRSHWEKI